jgi:hypothetical protein
VYRATSIRLLPANTYAGTDQLPLTQTGEQELPSGVVSAMKRFRNSNDFVDEIHDEEVCVALSYQRLVCWIVS